jgi:hypothetical protein
MNKKQGERRKVKARQIYCIFFLNYDIGLSNAPVLEVDQRVRDVASGEECSAKNEFIESLPARQAREGVSFL